eukprot:762949-Hanusia_phi.AAC.1
MSSLRIPMIPTSCFTRSLHSWPATAAEGDFRKGVYFGMETSDTCAATDNLKGFIGVASCPNKRGSWSLLGHEMQGVGYWEGGGCGDFDMQRYSSRPAIPNEGWGSLPNLTPPPGQLYSQKFTSSPQCMGHVTQSRDPAARPGPAFSRIRSDPTGRSESG